MDCWRIFAKKKMKLKLHCLSLIERQRDSTFNSEFLLNESLPPSIFNSSIFYPNKSEVTFVEFLWRRKSSGVSFPWTLFIRFLPTKNCLNFRFFVSLLFWQFCNLQKNHYLFHFDGIESIKAIPGLHFLFCRFPSAKSEPCFDAIFSNNRFESFKKCCSLMPKILHKFTSDFFCFCLQQITSKL